MKPSFRALSLGLASAVLSLGFSLSSVANDNFYAGKTINVISPSGTGGSIYLYNLLVANHIGRHIPGQPNAIVEERLGGGGITAANYVDNIAPQDGTVIAGLHPSGLLAPRLSNTARAANYNPASFQWLGSLAARTYVDVLWHEVPVRTFNETLSREVTMGATGRGAVTYQNPRFMSAVTGAQFRIVTGYSSGGELNLAMERGEIDGRGNYYPGFLATNPDWIEDQRLTFLYTMGPAHPDLPDVPAARDLISGEDNLAMLTMLEGPILIGQGFYVSGNVPTERVAILQTAFERMLEDPAFIAEAERLNLLIEPISAAEVTRIAEDVFAIPDSVAENLDRIISQ